MSEIENEFMIALAADDPEIIAPTFADLVDTIIAAEDRQGVIDQIMNELTGPHMEVIAAIADLILLQQAASELLTFSEWLNTDVARRISHADLIARIMHDDDSWPSEARTYAEFRDHIGRAFPDASQVLDSAWTHYKAMVIAPYGDVWTTTTEIQHAAKIAWSNGTDEIHPKTMGGTTRVEAERHAQFYNEGAKISARSTDSGNACTGSASVVRRTVVYGPWYEV